VKSLDDFAKNDHVRTGYTAWKDKNEANKKAFEEAVKGYKSGLPASMIARWLQKEKGCPLSEHTIREQLKTESYV
jgi:hypothetical protein|tara:strand:+ start:1154 stop:1378 length:225 start_codon:yes stop_codon:yes gene_type:complete